MVKFTTELGCSIIVVQPAESEDYILTLGMEQHGDGRRASVFLTPDERAQLVRALGEDELERARHDMPAELYNDLAAYLASAGRGDYRSLHLLERLRQKYGASTRRALGLDAR